MNQHQDYDKIIKETIEKLGTPILQKLLGVDASSIEDMPSAMPRTIERRADFLKSGIDAMDLIRKLFHLEFQSEVHKKMLQRLLVYWSLFYERYDIPVKQYVIYLGSGKWTADTSIDLPNLKFSYEVIAINTIDYELFVNSEQPEEIILSILADFKKENKADVVKKILFCLKNKTKNKKKLQKYIMQLEILSNLRNLQPEITKQLSTMSIHYDITKDLRFQQGIELGVEQGVNLGDELRLKAGIDKMLEKRFPLVEIAELLDTTIDRIIEIMNKYNLTDVKK
jgi:hypothetical protein